MIESVTQDGYNINSNKDDKSILSDSWATLSRTGAARRPISTDLPSLDAALLSSSPGINRLTNFSPTATTPSPSSQFDLPGWGQLSLNLHADDAKPAEGVQRGEVTDIVGPRGCGKTTLAMVAAANVLKSGETVVWIDTAGPICATRLEKILCSKINQSLDSTSSTSNGGDLLKNLIHFQPTTLAHLMALISHPPPGFPPRNTGLVVLDSVSCLFGREFEPFLNPLEPQGKPGPGGKKILHKDLRWSIIDNVVSSLKKMALRLDCAVIVTNEMISHINRGSKPRLYPAVAGWTWNLKSGTRMLIYWLRLPAEARRELQMTRVRVAEVRAYMGDPFPRSTKRIVPFVINDVGINEFTKLPIYLRQEEGCDDSGMINLNPERQMKRKIDVQHHTVSAAISPVRRRIKREHTSVDGEDEPINTSTITPVTNTPSLDGEGEVSDYDDFDEVWQAMEAAEEEKVESAPGEPSVEFDDTELLLQNMIGEYDFE
ncbi:hypothetical protein FQN57_002493 [Myotisia sp. PD_48]|nr:hypothetical protein FQN57_002493 [Myotisia sp. PD_48]